MKTPNGKEGPSFITTSSSFPSSTSSTSSATASSESSKSKQSSGSIALFIVGIILGVILTLSIVTRFNSIPSQPPLLPVQFSPDIVSNEKKSDNLKSLQNAITTIKVASEVDTTTDINGATNGNDTPVISSGFLAPPKQRPNRFRESKSSQLEDQPKSQQKSASSTASVTTTTTAIAPTIVTKQQSQGSNVKMEEADINGLVNKKIAWVPGRKGEFLRQKEKEKEQEKGDAKAHSQTATLPMNQREPVVTAAAQDDTSEMAAETAEYETGSATTTAGGKSAGGVGGGGGKMGKRKGGKSKKQTQPIVIQTADIAAAAVAAASISSNSNSNSPPSTSISVSETSAPKKTIDGAATTKGGVSTAVAVAVAVTVGTELFDASTGSRIDSSTSSSSSLSSSSSAVLALPYPPLLPYHSQSKSLSAISPYVPSLSSVTKQKQLIDLALKSKQKKWPETETSLHPDVIAYPLPDMSNQKAVFEKKNLKLHLCNGVFEAYSASWLTTKEHVLSVKSEGYNLTWVNCEMASFIHMRESNNFYVNPDGQGMIIQSLDVLDFSVIHLSTFERSNKKYMHKLWKTRQQMKTEWSKIDPIVETANLLDELINPAKTGKNITWSDDAKRTVVIMPFLGGAMGAGHSELGNRFQYLKACFWSFYEFVPNIVAGVSRKEDVEWAWKESGLPFYDIILLDNLPKSAGLPVGTTQRTKAKLQSGEWDFDYVFFTESDQILISRQLPLMYEHLKRYPQRMMLPHRLMVYSDRILTEIHKKSIDKEPNNWMKQSCCMPRQNCGERKSWRGIADESVAVINYHGLQVPLGNVNFLGEQYRACKLGPYLHNYCP